MLWGVQKLIQQAGLPGVFLTFIKGKVLKVGFLEGTATASFGNLLEMQLLAHAPDLLSQKLGGWHPAICV